jgi:electron transport complex protein RnfG
MEVIIGITIDGSVSGVKLGDNRETPGLGTKAANAPFITQFAGKLITMPITLVKKAPAGNEIQAITGATISSRAVTTSVQYAAQLAGAMLQEEVKKP